MQTVHRDGTFVLAVRPGTPGLPQEPLLRLATWLQRKHRNKGDIVMKNTTVVRDPVCGMDVELATAAGRADYKGQPYYFCGSTCKGSSIAIQSNTWASQRERRRAAMAAAVR